MLNKTIPFLLVLLFLSGQALTQPALVNGYAIQHFTDENGLPQNSINDLLFDNDGYLWLASQVGLVRFNGSTFRTYYPSDKPIMESNIYDLGKDDKGTIYFETNDHHLYSFAQDNNSLPPTIHTPVSLRPLLLNGHKQLFDFTPFLKNASSPVETVRRETIFRHLFDHGEDFFVTSAGHVYMVDQDSLYYYNGKELHTLSPVPGPSCHFLVDGNRCYVLARDTAVAVYDEDKRIRGPAAIQGDPRRVFPALSRDDYRLFSCGKVNHLLAGHLLYRLTTDHDGRLQAEFLIDLDFIPNISAIEYNAGLDLLLIATNTEGFYFLRKNRFIVDGWSPEMRARLAHHLFGPMALRSDDRIITDKFMFSPGGGFAEVKDHGPIWQRCLYIDRTRQIWAARDNQPRVLTSDMEPVRMLPALDANIIAYSEDSSGRLYCLTERSLWRLDGDAFHRLYTAGDGLNEVMACTGQHRFWIGSTNGLFQYDADDNQARSVPDLSGAHVRAIHRCRDGSWLIGTYGQGYFYYVEQRFHKMPLDKNGFLMTAHCFLEDKHGMIWIPCNKGLFKVPKRDIDARARGENSQLYYYYYGRQDGLLTNEFNGGFNASGVITPDGFAALLSMKGMVCFYADSLTTDFPRGAIDMTTLEIDGKPASHGDTIRTPAGYSSLLLKVASPYLGNRNNLYLESVLSGSGEDWKGLPEDGMINLSGLSPGTYRLRVRQVNGFGKDNYQYRQWTILVPPLFYRTIWFLVGAGLLLLLLVGLLIQLRLKLIEKKKQIRENDQQREKLISLVIHDLRSPLRFLTMLASDLHDNQDSLSGEELKERSYWVKKGAQDVYHFSEDFLLWVTSQKDNFRISKTVFHVRPLLREIYDFYLEQVLQRGNCISYEADEGLQLYSDPHLLTTIIRNLTDNANKYTEQGTIHISAVRDGTDILIVVADSGRGMNPRQVAAFLGHDNMDNLKSGSQLGHKFIHDLTKRLNGTLSVESVENAGTTVSLRIASV